MSANEAQRKLNIALYKMSPDLAGLIKEALGSRPEALGEETSTGHQTHTLDIPGQPSGLETIQERLQGQFQPTSETIKTFPHAFSAQLRQRLFIIAEVRL